MKKLFELFMTFAKIGVMTFGGGYAMLPILEREVVENKKWATNEEMADYYAIGQCTPGIIAINAATFIGRKEGGLAGAIFATAGMAFPGIVIICVIASLLTNFADYKFVRDAFAGVRACVCVLILNAVIKLLKGAVIDKITFLIFVAVLAASLFTPLSPAVFVVVAACIGVVLGMFFNKGASK